jgi:hypothetical protein
MHTRAVSGAELTRKKGGLRHLFYFANHSVLNQTSQTCYRHRRCGKPAYGHVEFLFYLSRAIFFVAHFESP